MNRMYEIEKINADNHRPGMPDKGYVVRYHPHEVHGWLCRKICTSLPEAETFAATLSHNNYKGA